MLEYQVKLGNLRLTARQAISYFIMRQCYVDYLSYLDYDCFDWQEWCRLNRN